MTTRFEALESRINAATLRHLGNATATLNGSPLPLIVGVEGNDLSVDELLANDNGAAGHHVLCQCPSASLPAQPVGKTVVITTGVAVGTWRIAYVHPDATGMTRITLTKT